MGGRGHGGLTPCVGYTCPAATLTSFLRGSKKVWFVVMRVSWKGSAFIGLFTDWTVSTRHTRPRPRSLRLCGPTTLCLCPANYPPLSHHVGGVLTISGRRIRCKAGTRQRNELHLVATLCGCHHRAEES
ncbi:hypothetical protein TcG_05640 [Trypanosoma cruzi]|nr:hypothetical protein TcG_05640 [Trypanosoma cruzi]